MWRREPVGWLPGAKTHSEGTRLLSSSTAHTHTRIQGRPLLPQYHTQDGIDFKPCIFITLTCDCRIHPCLLLLPLLLLLILRRSIHHKQLSLPHYKLFFPRHNCHHQPHFPPTPLGRFGLSQQPRIYFLNDQGSNTF